MEMSKTLSYRIELIIVVYIIFIMSCTNPSKNSTHYGIIINEFMIKNNESTGIVDSDFKSSDWVEIYNYSNETIFLADYFISDNIEEKYKAVLPAVYLEPGGYYLLWGGSSDAPGNDHLGFKFSADKDKGECILIFDKESNIVDSISYTLYEKSTENGYSFGRKPDASINWTKMRIATPGARNEY